MRTSAVLLRTGLVVALAFAACLAGAPDHVDDGGPQVAVDGGTSADAGSSADAGLVGLPLESACTTINHQRCDYLRRCGLIGDDGEAMRDCVNLLVATECGPSLWPARAVEGTVRYDAVAGQACADGWLAQGCEAWEEQPAPCGKLTSPNVPLGAECYGGGISECRSGTCTGGTCPRRCRAPGLTGELCEVNADCSTGLSCRVTMSGNAVGTCQPLSGAGEGCTSDTDCRTELYCGALSNCTAFAGIGQSCANTRCAPDTWCAPSASGPICAAPRARGEACTADRECEKGLLCLTETGTCEPIGPLEEGTPCSVRQQCTAGLTCVGTQPDPSQPRGLGTCAAPRGPAEPCTSSADCLEPLACVPAESGASCGDRRADGESCTESRDCSVLSRCSEGRCERLPRPGEPCPDGVCLFGNCGSASGGEPRCSEVGLAGAACTADLQCASKRCVEGACLAACSP